MLSSLQALNAAGAAPSSRSAAFQPKVKPRARKAAAADENIAPTEETSAVPPPSPAPAAPVAVPPAPAPAPVAAATARTPVPSNPVALREIRGVSPRSTQPTLPQSARLDPSAPSSSAGPSASSHKQREASTVPLSTSETGESSKRKRKRAPSSPSPRQKRGKSEINVDEAIDPATMTMKDIIKLAEAKERKKQKEEAAKKQEQRASTGGAEQRGEKEQAIPLAPQVEIVDGKIVINQQSLEVDARALNQDDVGSYRRIDETTTKLNYHSYMKKIPRERWKPEETDMFYKTVQQFGTDFAVINCLFPGKTRRQIKAKYKKEDRENPRRMSQTILQPRGDLAHYEHLVTKLKEAAAAEKTAEDEFDFTWDVNANKDAGEMVQEDMANAEYDGNEEDGDNGTEEDGCSHEEEVVPAPKEEERQECKPDYSAATPPPPALFAYETELPFAYA